MNRRLPTAPSSRLGTALRGRVVISLAPLAAGLVLGLLAVAIIGPAPRHQTPAIHPGAVAPEAGRAGHAPPIIRFAAVPPRVRTPRPRPSPEPLPTWRVHAAAAPPADGRPVIAVIIDDMGLDRRRSRRAASLPAPLTLAYLPYASGLARQTRAARARGHELLVHVPMEGIAPAGPNTLRPAQTPDELRRRLDWSLGRFEGYVGVNNHMGSRFTADPEVLAVVLGALRRRGLLFVDSRTTPDSAAAAVARATGIPFTRRDVFLDHDRRAAAVAASLAALERIARQRGHAVGIGHPHTTTIEALRMWIPDVTARGFVLVPVSAVVGRERSLVEDGRDMTPSPLAGEG